MTEGNPDGTELGLDDEREDGIVIGDFEVITLGLPVGFVVDGEVLGTDEG